MLCQWDSVPGLSLVDGWAFKNNMDIRNHQNLQDRLQAAHLLLARSPQCPVVVDTMQNQSSQLYAALPERLYVIQEGRILYKVVTWGQGAQGGQRGPGRARAKRRLCIKQNWIQITTQPLTSHVTMGECFHFLEFLQFPLLQNGNVGLHLTGDEIMHTNVPSIWTGAASSWLPFEPR